MLNVIVILATYYKHLFSDLKSEIDVKQRQVPSPSPKSSVASPAQTPGSSITGGGEGSSKMADSGYDGHSQQPPTPTTPTTPTAKSSPSTPTSKGQC